MTSKKVAKRVSLALLAIVALILTTACAAMRVEPTPTPTPEPKVIAAGVTMNGVNVAGLTADEAREFFNNPDMLPALGVLTLKCGEDSYELDASSIKGAPLLDDVFAAALSYDDETAPVPEGGAAFTVEYTYDVSPLRATLMTLADEMTVAPVDATYAFDTTVDGNFVYTDGVSGRSVAATALYAAVSEYVSAGDFTNPVEVPFEDVQPAVTLETVKNQTTLISTAVSSFARGSYGASNRVFNMEKALSMFDGHVLMPGEEFSFNTVLGPRYTKYGWKLAGAINNGKSVEEPGGGVCQVSSTTFNTVLMADLEVVERAPHSWPLSYLPSGQDATINTGTQDFIFKNNRTTPIIIATDIDKDEKTVTVNIYGEALPNGTTIKLRSEKTGTIPQPADQIVVDNTLAPGTSVVDREGRSGSKYVTYKDYYDAAGNLIESVKAYNTSYRAISTIILQGPDLPTDLIPEEPDIPDEDGPTATSSPEEEPEEDPDLEPEPEESFEPITLG